MKHVEQKIWQKAEAESKLQSMNLDREKLIRAGLVAISQANNTTANFPRNAWGTFAYHHGTAEIRNQFVGPVWSADRNEGIETIVDESNMRKVVFQNVDSAMGTVDPQPRSPKGAGTERACEGNLPLFPGAAKFVPVDPEIYEMWALMVDEAGNMELSRPVVVGGTFSICRERIFIADADDWLGPPSDEGSGDDDADDYDVEVSRK